MEIKDRLQYILEAENLSATQFTDILGVQRSSMSHILSGRNKPSLDYLQKILTKFPAYNANWLILGEGEIQKEQMPQQATNGNRIYSPNPPTNTLFTNVNTPKEEEIIPPAPPVQEETKSEQLAKMPDTPPKTEVPPKKIDKIVIFYTDGTFQDYNQTT